MLFHFRRQVWGHHVELKVGRFGDFKYEANKRRHETIIIARLPEPRVFAAICLEGRVFQSC